MKILNSHSRATLISLLFLSLASIDLLVMHTFFATPVASLISLIALIYNYQSLVKFKHTSEKKSYYKKRVNTSLAYFISSLVSIIFLYATALVVDQKIEEKSMQMSKQARDFHNLHNVFPATSTTNTYLSYAISYSKTAPSQAFVVSHYFNKKLVIQDLKNGTVQIKKY